MHRGVFHLILFLGLCSNTITFGEQWHQDYSFYCWWHILDSNRSIWLMLYAVGALWFKFRIWLDLDVQPVLAYYRFVKMSVVGNGKFWHSRDSNRFTPIPKASRHHYSWVCQYNQTIISLLWIKAQTFYSRHIFNKNRDWNVHGNGVGRQTQLPWVTRITC